MNVFCFFAAVYGSQFPRFQKNYWYEYSSPPSTTYPGKFEIFVRNNKKSIHQKKL